MREKEVQKLDAQSQTDKFEDPSLTELELLREENRKLEQRLKNSEWKVGVSKLQITDLTRQIIDLKTNNKE